MIFSASAWTYIDLFGWAVLAALVNIAIAQFYFLCHRKRLLASSTLLMTCSIIFISAYLLYSILYIFPYFTIAYYWMLPKVDAGSRLLQNLADVTGTSYSLDISRRARIWTFFLIGAVALPALELKFIFSRWLYPYLHHLAETVKELKTISAESDDWTDMAWRQNSIENIITKYEGTVEDLCRHWLEEWELNHERDFSWPALLAVFFLGEKNFKETRQNLVNDNAEPIRRWSMITGKKIPTW
jgi:hypothetical protein